MFIELESLGYRGMQPTAPIWVLLCTSILVAALNHDQPEMSTQPREAHYRDYCDHGESNRHNDCHSSNNDIYYQHRKQQKRKYDMVTNMQQSSTRTSSSDDETQYVEKESQRKRSKPLVMPETYDGTTSWLDYKAHFEACALVNEWSDSEMMTFLRTRLSGAARRTLSSIPATRPHGYSSIVDALTDRFEPYNREDLYFSKLKTRQLQPNEKVEDLADDIRRMCELAYPTLDFNALERIGRHHFLDAITDQVLRHDISLSGVKTLTKAVKVASERNAFLAAEKIRNENSKVQQEAATETRSWEDEKREMQQKIDSIAAELKWWKQQVAQPIQYNRITDKSRRSCHYCDQLGHYFYECRKKADERLYQQQNFQTRQFRGDPCDSTNSNRVDSGNTLDNRKRTVNESVYNTTYATEQQGN